jgi:hypothetical protein
MEHQHSWGLLTKNHPINSFNKHSSTNLGFWDYLGKNKKEWMNLHEIYFYFYLLSDNIFNFQRSFEYKFMYIMFHVSFMLDSIYCDIKNVHN